MQFIPRAFVFITIIVLYSMLFNFLRRPDTINVSSHYTIGNDGDMALTEDRREGDRETQQRPSLIPRWKFSRDATGAGSTSIERAKPGAVVQEPWEQVSFVNIGGKNALQGILVSRPTSPSLDPPGLDRLGSDGSDKMDPFDTPTTRGQSISTLNGSDKAYPLLPAVPLETVQSTDSAAPAPDYMGDQQRDRQNSQSLAAFFQEYQITTHERQAASGPQPVSAAQYFNRQASLLMLYFPLAVGSLFIDRTSES